MKTTIDIPTDLLREAIRHTGAKTKREAVLSAMDEFNRHRRLKALADRLHGSCPHFISRDELRKARIDHKWEAAR